MWKLIMIGSIFIVGIGAGSYNIGFLGVGLIGMIVSFIKACIDFSNTSTGKEISNYVTRQQKDYENEFGIIDWKDKK